MLSMCLPFSFIYFYSRFSRQYVTLNVDCELEMQITYFDDFDEHLFARMIPDR